MNYQILRCTDAEELEHDVRKALASGWKLQGGVTICTRGESDVFFAQAIIKE